MSRCQGASGAGKRKATMVPFNGIGNEYGMYQGVFISGPHPTWLIAHRGTYAVHTMAYEGEVSAFTPWHNISHSHGFVSVSATANELRFSLLPPHVRYQSFPLCKVT